MKQVKVAIPHIVFPASFTYSCFRFKLRLLDAAVLPVFKGSMLRGLLGTGIKHLYCKKSVPCPVCSQVKSCPYSNLFKLDLERGRRWVTPPFVIYSSSEKELLERDDILEFTITLFGEYSRNFEYFFNAINYAGRIGIGVRRAAYVVEEIRDEVSGEWVYRDREVNLKWQVANARLSEFKLESAKRIRIEFLTPILLKKNKKQQIFPDMREVINALIRRVHIISRSIWNDQEFFISKDFVDDLQVGIDRYDLHYQKNFTSGGSGNTVELSGFSGIIECCHDFSRLVPLFRAGEVLHLGARTSYGLGKIGLTVL